MANETKKKAAGAAEELDAERAEVRESDKRESDKREGERTVDPVEVLERMKAELENARAAIAERDRAIAVQKELIERLNAALVGMCGVYSYDGR